MDDWRRVARAWRSARRGRRRRTPSGPLRQTGVRPALPPRGAEPRRRNAERFRARGAKPPATCGKPAFFRHRRHVAAKPGDAPHGCQISGARETLSLPVASLGAACSRPGSRSGRGVAIRLAAANAAIRCATPGQRSRKGPRFSPVLALSDREGILPRGAISPVWVVLQWTHYGRQFCDYGSRNRRAYTRTGGLPLIARVRCAIP